MNLSTAQVALILGVTRQAVAQLAAKIKVKKVGASYVWTQSDIKKAMSRKSK
jgi:acyl CoA:acetate/3-ketoacid CoA transferase alpha subunit